MRDFLHSPWGPGVFWLVFMLPVGLVMWWLQRRDRRAAAERQRHDAVQQQLLEMQQQIWDEQLSDEARAAQRRARESAAEVRREARCRLGLLEEEPRC